jgi:hypothetical protein
VFLSTGTLIDSTIYPGRKLVKLLTNSLGKLLSQFELPSSFVEWSLNLNSIKEFFLRCCLDRALSTTAWAAFLEVYELLKLYSTKVPLLR